MPVLSTFTCARLAAGCCAGRPLLLVNLTLPRGEAKPGCLQEVVVTLPRTVQRPSVIIGAVNADHLGRYPPPDCFPVELFPSLQCLVGRAPGLPLSALTTPPLGLRASRPSWPPPVTLQQDPQQAFYFHPPTYVYPSEFYLREELSLLPHVSRYVHSLIVIQMFICMTMDSGYLFYPMDE